MLDSMGSKLKGKTAQTGSAVLQPGFFLSLWVLLRLPLFIAAVYLIWPDEFIWLITLLAIHLLGTIPERLALFILILAGLGGTFFTAEKLRLTSKGRYLAALGVAFGLFWLLFSTLPDSNPLTAALFLTSVMAINAISGIWWVNFMANKPGRWITNGLLALVIGLAETLLPKPLLLWLLRQWGAGEAVVRWVNRRLVYWLPVIWIAGLGALFPTADSLADLHRAIFPNPAVQMFARGNFNWLELDVERRNLYAAGFGTNYLQSYSMDALDKPPQISPVENGYAQGFAYNPGEQELYVYNQSIRQLLFLDATTLALKKSVAVPQVSPGDAWVLWDELSDNIIIASEADEKEGFPFIVLEPTTGKTLDALRIDPGNVLMHPHKPVLYLSFFRRSNELVKYDTQRLEILNQTPAGERLDRMAFVENKNSSELLVASPLEAAVWRFDAETLKRIGAIPAQFGVRTLAVDSTRRLLFCGNLVTNSLEVIDLTTQKHLAKYYLGPWLRTIVLDTTAGIAYVSSHTGLFTVQYAD